MYSVGPYTFSETDAERTLAHLPQIWERLAEGADRTRAATVLAPLYPSHSADDDNHTRLAAAWDAMLAAGPALRDAGLLPARYDGTVTGLHCSDGGVPKSTVDSVDVDWAGVVGDRQRTRRHHGRPWQALCIWSAEVIDQFADDGHPIAPGNAGENVTVRGLPWHLVRPGVRLQLGEVLCDVTAYAEPCKQNARWFTDGRFDLMHADRGPVSRVYATVLVRGRITTGDAATLEP